MNSKITELANHITSDFTLLCTQIKDEFIPEHSTPAIVVLSHVDSGFPPGQSSMPASSPLHLSIWRKLGPGTGPNSSYALVMGVAPVIQ